MELPPLKIVGMLMLFVMLILFGALYLTSGGGGQKGQSSITTIPIQTSSTTTVNLSTTPTTIAPTFVNNITVSGTINVTGNGMNATKIVFYQANDNITYATNVSGGSYSINLPDFKTYDVVVFWAGLYPWQTGFDPVKPVTWPFVLGVVNQTNATYNVNLTLPNGLTNLNGTVFMTAPNVTPSGQILRRPTQINFKAPNGMTFTGNIIQQNLTGTAYVYNVTNNQTYQQQYNYTIYNYTLELPNWQTYNVSIKWAGQYNTGGSCSETPLAEYAAIGTINQTRNYRC